MVYSNHLAHSEAIQPGGRGVVFMETGAALRWCLWCLRRKLRGRVEANIVIASRLPKSGPNGCIPLHQCAVIFLFLILNVCTSFYRNTCYHSLLYSVYILTSSAELEQSLFCGDYYPTLARHRFFLSF